MNLLLGDPGQVTVSGFPINKMLPPSKSLMRATRNDCKALTLTIIHLKKPDHQDQVIPIFTD